MITALALVEAISALIADRGRDRHAPVLRSQFHTMPIGEDALCRVQQQRNIRIRGRDASHVVRVVDVRAAIVAQEQCAVAPFGHSAARLTGVEGLEHGGELRRDLAYRCAPGT